MALNKTLLRLTRLSISTRIRPATKKHVLFKRAIQQRHVSQLSGTGYSKFSFSSIWKIGNEWKIVSPLLIAVVSYLINLYIERKETRKKLKLDRINLQLCKLYGPLYGNRLVNEASFKAVMKEYKGLDNYLEQACQNKDGEMIRQWRLFVTNVLYPLDKEAVQIICNNAHLIPEDSYPPEFDLFLEHVARLQFVMELWKSGNGKLETIKEFTEEDYFETNNASGIRERSKLVDYVRNKCTELRKTQTTLELELDSDAHAENFVSQLVKRGFKH